MATRSRFSRPSYQSRIFTFFDQYFSNYAKIQQIIQYYGKSPNKTTQQVIQAYHNEARALLRSLDEEQINELDSWILIGGSLSLLKDGKVSDIDSPPKMDEARKPFARRPWKRDTMALFGADIPASKKSSATTIKNSSSVDNPVKRRRLEAAYTNSPFTSTPFPFSGEPSSDESDEPKVYEVISSISDHVKPETSVSEMKSEDDITTIDLDTYVPNNLRNCPICAGTLTTWDFPSFNVTMNCAHEDKVCFGCLEKYIHMETQSKSLERITQLCCPLCPEKLSHDNCRAYATKADFERYDQLLAISAVPEAAMCLGPSCVSAQAHEGGPLMICDACNFQTCVKHNIPWHAGETCDEYDKRVSMNIKRLEDTNAPVAADPGGATNALWTGL